MSNVPYFQSMSDFEPLTPSKVAALANAVQTLYQQPINDNISLTGTTAATTNTYLDFGYNVITTATATNYACRLPNPPIKGRSTVIVNNSGFPIVIYPSVTGGSINGVVNGSATVPSDGKPYTFFCYENPLPGGWTWTPPAIGQYDSGVITVNSTGGNNVIAALNASSWSESQGFTTSNSWGYGSLVEPPISGSIYRPNPYWNSVKKVKVYTNLLDDSGGFVFALAVNGQITYYQVGTTNIVTNGFTLMGDYGGYGYLTSTVPGTPIGTTLSLNVGDPGTKYGVLDFSSIVTPLAGGVGDYYMGTQLVNGVLRDKWNSNSFLFQFQPNTGAITGLKVQFFIEYS